LKLKDEKEKLDEAAALKAKRLEESGGN